MFDALDREGRRVFAARALRDQGPFQCPDPVCNSPVFIREDCDRHVRHFAHPPNSRCARGEGESEEHFRAKHALSFGLSHFCGCYTALEQRCGSVQPDVLFCPIDGINENEVDPPELTVAVEIQASPIGIDEIRRRTSEYERLNLAVFWCILNDGRFRPGYSPSPWEEFLHDMYEGMLWLYEGVEGTREFVTPFCMHKWRNTSRGRYKERIMAEGNSREIYMLEEIDLAMRGDFPNRLLWSARIDWSAELKSRAESAAFWAKLDNRRRVR